MVFIVMKLLLRRFWAYFWRDFDQSYKRWADSIPRGDGGPCRKDSYCRKGDGHTGWCYPAEAGMP
jgi:hypothetical protein